MIVERSISWVEGNIVYKSQNFTQNCSAKTHGAVDKATE